jgi:hypothetical protein
MLHTLRDVRHLWFPRSVLLTLLWVSSLTSANAQPSAGTCSDRVLVRYVYAVLLNQGSYEYRAYIRNLTRDTLGWSLSLGSLPEDVSTPPEHMSRGVLAPHAGETLRIGRGPTAAVNLGTVDVLYDRTGGARPYISLHSCLVRPR